MATSLIDVVAAVILDDGLYLACRRAPHRGGQWEFPGGKVEVSEDPRAALAREVLEELDVEIVVGDEIAVATESQIGIRLTSFAATLVGSRPSSSTDHDLLEWFEAAELPRLDWAHADLATVEALVAASRGAAVPSGLERPNAADDR